MSSLRFPNEGRSHGSPSHWSVAVVARTARGLLHDVHPVIYIDIAAGDTAHHPVSLLRLTAGTLPKHWRRHGCPTLISLPRCEQRHSARLCMLSQLPWFNTTHLHQKDFAIPGKKKAVLRSPGRRDVLGSTLAIAMLGLLPGPASALTLKPRQRVIIDNDFSGDPDGLFQLAHHLASPSVDMSTTFSTSRRPRPITQLRGLMNCMRRWDRPAGLPSSRGATRH